GGAAAYAVQTGATVIAAILVFVVGHRGSRLPVRAATLAAATLVAIPVVLIYDLMLAAIAAAWLLRDEDGLSARETVALASLFILKLDRCGIAEAWHVPVAPLAAAGMVALVAVHAFRAGASTVRYVTA